MGKVLITEQHLTNIADAIRFKKDSTDKYRPEDMASAIRLIGYDDIDIFSFINVYCSENDTVTATNGTITISTETGSDHRVIAVPTPLETPESWIVTIIDGTSLQEHTRLVTVEDFGASYKVEKLITYFGGDVAIPNWTTSGYSGTSYWNREQITTQEGIPCWTFRYPQNQSGNVTARFPNAIPAWATTIQIDFEFTANTKYSWSNAHFTISSSPNVVNEYNGGGVRGITLGERDSGTIERTTITMDISDLDYEVYPNFHDYGAYCRIFSLKYY